MSSINVNEADDTSSNSGHSSGSSSSSSSSSSNVDHLFACSDYWYDIFKFLRRRQLLRTVQPACRWFNIIAESVPNRHYIYELDSFLDALTRNELEANHRLEVLESVIVNEVAANNTFRHLRLGGQIHFRMGHYWQIEAQMRRSHAQQHLLRIASALFHGCALVLTLRTPSAAHTILQPNGGDGPSVYMELLQTVPLSRITFHLTSSFNEMDQLLHQPAILNCPHLSFSMVLFFAPPPRVPHVAGTFEWLHHVPDLIGATMPRQMRILFYPAPNLDGAMIEKCQQTFREAENPGDQRAFVLITRQPVGDQIPLFRMYNGATGEMLLLERHLVYHCLRRCLATEVPKDEEATRIFYQNIIQKSTTQLNRSFAARPPVLWIN